MAEPPGHTFVVFVLCFVIVLCLRFLFLLFFVLFLFLFNNNTISNYKLKFRFYNVALFSLKVKLC